MSKKATYKATNESGTTIIQVSRDYQAGEPPTAPRVWEIVADFGCLKKIFPSLLRVHVAYPDANSTSLATLRDMTFKTPDGAAFGVEQLVAIDETARHLKYISLQGLPVENYESVMKVEGDNACTLTWTSTFIGGPEGFGEQLAGILSGGADQIAASLGLD